MNEVAPTTSMTSDSNTATNSTSSTEMANSDASMSPSPSDMSMITPVSEPTSTSADTPAPVNATTSADTPMTTTDASVATGSISSLESSIQSAADAALADAQTQAPATTSGTVMGATQNKSMVVSNPYSDRPESLVGEGIWAVFGLIYVTVTILILVSQYILSRKLKLEYPWLGLIPVANIYNLVKIAGHQGWKVLLAIIPIVSFFYVAFSLLPAISRRTGHGVWTSVGLFFLSPIVFPYIAFTYKGADETTASVSPTIPGTPATF